MTLWLNQSAVQRLLKHGYVIREIVGVDIAEPQVGRGPAYVQDPATGWWEYLYDVVVDAPSTDILVGLAQNVKRPC